MINEKKIVQKKIGIVLATCNRPDYLKQTLRCLSQSVYPQNCTLLIIDDNSDQATKNIILNWENPQIETIKIFSAPNKGVWESLRFGFEYFKHKKFDLFCNLDSDTLVNKMWLVRLYQLYEKLPAYIITGFNAANTNRHPIIDTYELCHTKKSIGGVNLFFGTENYELIIKSLDAKSAWDWKMCKLYKTKERRFLVTRPSVVQHIGVKSMLAHTDTPDMAIDFVE